MGGATWVTGAPLGADAMPPGAPTGLNAVGGTHLDRPSPGTRNTELDLAGYNVYRATSHAGADRGHAAQRRDPAHGRPPTPTRAPTAGTTYYYVVTAVDFSGNQSLASVAASAQASGSGANRRVQLNGSSQYVTFGAAPALQRRDTFTLETVVPAHRRGRGRHHGHAAASPAPSR